jgi:hypothetical protein
VERALDTVALDLAAMAKVGAEVRAVGVEELGLAAFGAE